MSVIYRTPSSLFTDTSTDKNTIQSDSVGATSTIAVSLLNNTAAAAGAPQNSGVLELIGAGWDSSGSASITNKFGLQVQSVSGAYSPTTRQGDGYLVLLNSYNGGSYSSFCNIDGYGNVSLSQFLISSGSATSTNLAPTVTWTTMSGFSNSYVTPATGWSTARYTKDATGLVHLQGSVMSGTDGATIFTLPAGFRPAKAFRCRVVVDDAVGNLIVGSDGTLKAVTGGHTNVFFDNVFFMAEG